MDIFTGLVNFIANYPADFTANPYAHVAGIIGLAITIFALMTNDTRKRRWRFLFLNGFFFINFLLLGAGTYSAAAMYALAVFQIIILLVREELSWPIASGFIALTVLAGTQTYHDSIDLIPIFAGIANMFAMMEKNTTRFRIIILANIIAWIVYDTIIYAPEALLMQIIAAISNIAIYYHETRLKNNSYHPSKTNRKNDRTSSTRS